jgi:hypothetical protein
VVAKPVKAIVRWLSPKEGGRKAPPSGPTYATVAGFGNAPPSLEEAWSLVLEFESEPDAELKHRVRVQFLSPEAPQELLHPGSHFQLYEGSQLVARGEVQDGQKE